MENSNLEIIFDCYMIEIARRLNEKNKKTEIEVLNTILYYDFNNRTSSIYFLCGYFGVSSSLPMNKNNILKVFSDLVVALKNHFNIKIKYTGDLNMYYSNIELLKSDHAKIKLVYI